MTEEPGDRPAPGRPPGPPPPYAPGVHGPGPQGYPPPGYYPAPPAVPAHPQATLALALGIAGLAGALFFCGMPLLVSPVAWGIGQHALGEIRRSGGRLGGESSARTGMVLGIVGTVLLVVWVVVVVLVVVLLVAGDFASVHSPRGQSV